MSDGLTFASATLARLREQAKGTSVTVLDSVTLNHAEDVPTGPFLIFWDGADRVFSDRLDDTPSVYDWRCFVICGGRRADQMRWAVRFTHRALAGWWIDDQGALHEPPGRTSSEIEDSTIPSDVRHTRTLEFRHQTNWR